MNEKDEGHGPYILGETDDFAVVFKPPRMHCAPQKSNPAPTLLDWYAAVFPPVADVAGRGTGEGGLMHRLDFETQGLTLFAKHQRSFDFFLAMQEAGSLVKEYSALCLTADVRLDGFPPPPDVPPEASLTAQPLIISSFFRPYGPGRKAVRPALELSRKGREIAADHGDRYRTEIVSMDENALTLRLRRGFRHQIRCHLAWIGRPIANDPLYGAQTAPHAADLNHGFLALRSHGLSFADPRTQEPREYRIAPLKEEAD